MSDEQWNIPPSWSWTRIEKVGRVVSGGTPSTKEPANWGSEVVWFSPADLTGYKAKYISRGAKSLSRKGLSSSSAQLMPKGTVMFSSRAPIGYIAIASVEAATNQGFKSIVPGEGIFNEYLYYYLKAVKHLAEERATGTTFKEISGSAFAKLPIPVAPSIEQRRIVAKIEELWSELDKGVEGLIIAREQLKAYRQSVLKHAFEGRFLGNTGGRNSLWPKRKLGELIEFLTSGSRGWADYYSDHGDLFIRAQNLKHDRLDLSDIAFVRLPEGKTEGVRTRIRLGDVLVTITGANVTKTGLVDRDLGTAYVSQHVALCRLAKNLLPEFLYWYLLSETGGRRQLNEAAYGAGKPGLNLDNIKNVLIPLPSLAEQKAVVSLIATSLEAESHLRGDVSTTYDRTVALRQSILKSAFSGQLVPQDASDEPAAVLLERIRAGREVGNKRRNNKNGKKKAA